MAPLPPLGLAAGRSIRRRLDGRHKRQDRGPDRLECERRRLYIKNSQTHAIGAVVADPQAPAGGRGRTRPGGAAVEVQGTDARARAGVIPIADQLRRGVFTRTNSTISATASRQAADTMTAGQLNQRAASSGGPTASTISRVRRR